MDFATIYVDFMKDRSPALYRELAQKGVLHAHAQQRAREASIRLDAFIEANGFQNDLNGRRMVEEIVLHEMLDEITPDEDKPSPAVQAQWEAFISGARAINVVDEEDEPDEFLEEEEEVDDLDDEAAAEILAHFEGSMLSTEQVGLYDGAAPATLHGWVPEVDDIDEPEAASYLKILRETSNPSLKAQPPTRPRGPRMSFQYRVIRARWADSRALLEQLAMTGLLCTYLRSIADEVLELADRLRSDPSTSGVGAETINDWAMRALLDGRTEGQKRMDSIAYEVTGHLADKTSGIQPRGPWGIAAQLAGWIILLSGLALSYAVVGEGLRALGWWSDWVPMILVIGPVVLAVVAWGGFTRWRGRFHADTVRATLNASVSDSSAGAPRT